MFRPLCVFDYRDCLFPLVFYACVSSAMRLDSFRRRRKRVRFNCLGVIRGLLVVVSVVDLVVFGGGVACAAKSDATYWGLKPLNFF